MDKTFYVTTPIYYVNAEPHIGHAYSTILADFMARFHKLLGHETYFLTGTDEHGDKIVQAAESKKTSPKEYVDRVSSLFKQTWSDIGISNDDFIRTTEQRHIKVVQDILQKVYDSGDIYFGSYGGHYCVGCERFFTEKEIVDGKCPDHKTELKYIEEKNYFFKMAKYQQWLIEYINSNENFIRPEKYKNEVLAMLRGEALEDLCISRPKSRLTWGIELPFDKNFVTYVWFDALINYISAVGYPDSDKFKKFWPHVNHIIAKDIVKPHGIFWPTMLKSAGIEPYSRLNVHGYWNMGEAKMSKSLGNVVTPKSLVDKFGNDQIRYFFLREMTFGHDAKFSQDVIIDRINFDLANDFGNLVKRTFNMADKYFGSKIPPMGNDKAGSDDISARLLDSAKGYISLCSQFQTSAGLEKLWEFVRHLNKYIDETKPWQLAKENSDRLSSVIRNLLEGIYSIALLSSPVFINISPLVIKALSALPSPADAEKLSHLDSLKSGSKIEQLDVLFPRIEKEGPAEEAKPEKKQDATTTEGLIEFTDFTKVDIRVAEVLEAEVVEGSDKLLQLKVDSGLDQRIIIAGIAKSYSPESLTGKKILLVANLKPATIFKRKSNGMLLAAKMSKDDAPSVIFVDNSIPTGARLG